MKTDAVQGPEERRKRLSLAFVAGAIVVSLSVLGISIFGVSLIAMAMSFMWLFLVLAIAVLVAAAAVAMVAAGLADSLIKRRTAGAPVVAQEPVEEIPARPGLVTASDIQGVDLLKQLSLQQLAQVAAIARRTCFLTGTLLARQGDKGDAVYIVLEGRVQLSSTSGLGDITIRVAGSGESLPLAALVGSRELISTARAMTMVGAVEIPCDAFFELCRKQPEIGVEVYRSMADILATRYRSALSRLTGTLDQALRKGDVFANM